MNLFDLPIEILHNISDYLDIGSIMRLHMVSKYTLYVYKYTIMKKLKEYISNFNIIIAFNIENFDNNSISMLMYILLFIKNTFFKAVTVTIFKKAGKSNYFAIKDNKCVFFLKGEGDLNLASARQGDFKDNMDRLENCLLNCRINDRQIKSNFNIYEIGNNVDVIYLHRTNYNTIYEDVSLNLNNLSMVTFHLFL